MLSDLAAPAKAAMVVSSVVVSSTVVVDVDVVVEVDVVVVVVVVWKQTRSEVLVRFTISISPIVSLQGGVYAKEQE